MKVGDVAIVLDRDPDEFSGDELLWHRRCIEAALVRPTDDAGDYLGEKCQDCSRPMADTDDIFVFNQGRSVHIDREIVWHRHCISVALETAPEERRVGR